MQYDSFVYEYPLDYVHEGTMLGNGYLGLYAWGSENTLNVTVGCGDLWDHRGGMKWSPKHNYKDIKAALDAGDADAIKAIFATDTENIPGQPRRPSIIPVGRIVFTLKNGAVLLRNELNRLDGCLKIYYQTDGHEAVAQLRLDMENKGIFALKCDDVAEFKAVPSFELTKGEMEAISFEKPEMISRSDLSGFVQPMPADAAFGLAVMQDGGLFSAAFRRNNNISQLKVDLAGSGADDLSGVSMMAESALMKMLPGLTAIDWDALEHENADWWNKYWAAVPAVKIGSDLLEKIYYEGLYKFGSMTAPDGVPAGLQGPWIEDHALPPWSGDYHFNINIQMCYWPAFRSNHLANIRRLFDMVFSWRDQLRLNAKYYVGIEDGYMLPHAVDDRCVCMGAFWTGTIDHACTAWIAQLMFDYVDYSGDMDYLRENVFDFMRGTMKVFLATLEKRGDKLALPLSVSPEYRGSEMNAWGVNSSFQLAAFRRLALNLIKAAEMLKEPVDPAWQELLDRLPVASIVENARGQKEIGLWDGLLLEESHRHHSHLAGLCPFDVIDPDAEEWKPIVAASINRWIELGQGLWTGWCTPWAAMIHNRLGNAEAADFILNSWRSLFNNKGGGSLHDSAYRGIRIFAGRPYIMQMDGMMGATAAVQDMLLHSRQGVLHLFAGISAKYKDVSFEKMPAPGGVTISAWRGNENRVLVHANRDGEVKLVFHGCKVESAFVSINNAHAYEQAANVPVALKLKTGDNAVICLQ